MTDGQQALDGMERTTKFKFTGVKYESLKGDFVRGEEVEFRVRGKVKMIGDEDMTNGTVHLVKIEVDSVAPVSFDEPADPSVQVLDGQGTLDDEAAE